MNGIIIRRDNVILLFLVVLILLLLLLLLYNDTITTSRIHFVKQQQIQESSSSSSSSGGGLFLTKNHKIFEEEYVNNDHHHHHHRHTTKTKNWEAPEPYDEIHDYCTNCSNLPFIKESPDPLISTTWRRNSTNSLSQLQYYRVLFDPTKHKYKIYNDKENDDNDDAMQNITPRTASSSSNNNMIIISSNTTLMIDWGVERAAWLEFMMMLKSPAPSPNNNKSTSFNITASISEYNTPYPGKTRRPLTRYGNHTYRLETNKELYEGIRYTWIYFDTLLFDNNTTTSDETIIEISNISLVAKIKPINYTGSFYSSSKLLTKAWYTGAYGVRLNIEETQFNSILVERGDRVAIQGDGHPTIAAALVVFSPYNLIKHVLNETDSGSHHVVDENIMSYPLYWSFSVIDYYMSSGDLITFTHLVKDIMIILDRRINDFLNPNLDIQWFGWDDRLGNGWCFMSKNNDTCPIEAHLAFAVLVVRLCHDFAHTLKLAGIEMKAQSSKYFKAYKKLGQRLISIEEYPTKFGIHAAANAINAGIVDRNVSEYWMDTILNDPVNICSISQFNQYWILQAFGNNNIENNNNNKMEYALASIQLCWGTPLKLGRGCFWELSSPEWLRFMTENGDQAPGIPSTCHPWSSGVTAWLSHKVGGIQPIQPGYKSFVVAPYLSIQYPSVKASISTPIGQISVNATLLLLQQEHNNNGDGDEADVDHDYDNSNHEDSSGWHTINAIVQIQKSDISDGSAIGYFGLAPNLALPNGKMEGGKLVNTSISMNGIPVTNLFTYTDIMKRQQHLSQLTTAVERILLIWQRSISSRTKVVVFLQISSSDDLSFPPFPNPYYPATSLGIDVDSQGDGLHVHGEDGYVLFGCHDNGKDIVKLPAYISNVSLWQHGYPGWLQPKHRFIGRSIFDKRYLPLDPRYTASSTKNRALGTVGFDDMRGGEINDIIVHIEYATEPSTMGGNNSDNVIDRSNKKRRPIFISAYFVADSADNKHTIRVMDLDTLNVIAPTVLIENYKNGVWWTMKYDKSVRLRLTNLKGINISAIAFSTTQHDERTTVPSNE